MPEAYIVPSTFTEGVINVSIAVGAVVNTGDLNARKDTVPRCGAPPLEMAAGQRRLFSAILIGPLARFDHRRVEGVARGRDGSRFEMPQHLRDPIELVYANR